jgi:MFS family permease
MSELERDEAPKSTAAQSMLSLYLPALILGLGSSIAAPALPVYAKSFDVSFGVASLAIIVYGLGSTVATVPTGYLIDRVGRRKIVLAGPIMTALTSFLVVTAQSFPELLVYRFLGGWALQMWMLGRLAMITDTGGERRGRQITGMYGMDSTGRLLGPAVGGFAAAIWDVRVPFILHGILALLAIVPSFRLVRETNPAGQRTAERAESGTVGWRATMAQLLAVPVLMLFLVQLLASMTRGSIWGGTLDLYVVYAYGLGPEALGLLVAVTSAIGVPITFGIGHVMDRFGRKATLVPGLVLLGLGLLSMAVTAFASLAFSVYAVSLFLVRAAVSATSGTMQVLASDVAPPQGRGRFLGAWRLVSELGQLMSPVAFAVLSEGYGFGVAFLFLSLTSLGAAFVLGALVKETLGARRQQAPLASGS